MLLCSFLAGFKCPVCSKFVSSDEMDLHLVMCLTKPRVTYNVFAASDFGVLTKSDRVGLLLGPMRSPPSRIVSSEDILTKDAEECAICLEQLVQGDTIARLPCLCIYHKG
ncbi:hypothetical protein Z043_103959 [Scleropages formosus]|uniref:RING-type E3 ubiquitin transferase n=1 Tax=Scleropages formosus TaxID=113540 RepID=A0A0P7VL87_SCLFO|nr:hypothetical protein Z043_103959 [Scleropages formosus]